MKLLQISVPNIIHPFPRSFHQSEFSYTILGQCILMPVAQFWPFLKWNQIYWKIFLIGLIWPWKVAQPILLLLFSILGNKNVSSKILLTINLKIWIRFRKNRIYLSVGVGGGGETAEKRVENELRQAIKNKHPASSTNVAASSISSSQNSCKSFHDSMIEQANAARTGEAFDATTSIIINIRDYLKKPYLPWSTDPLSYWLSEKKIRMYPTLYWSS